MSEVKELAMNAAHRRKSVAARERTTQSRIDLGLVRFLVGDEFLRDNSVCLADKIGPYAGGGGFQGADHVPQPGQTCLELHVLFAQGLGFARGKSRPSPIAS